jgi:DNA-binding NarL/FixJ family response regulator
MKPGKKSAPATQVPAPVPAAPGRKQILVVDDHPMMRAGLIQLIDKQPDLQVCAEAGNPSEAFDRLEKSRPDMVLTDITMPGRSGIEFIKDLLAQDAGLRILVISMHDETMYAERILQAGARGYIMKESGGENLMEAIRQVLAGRVYVSSRISARILDNISLPRPRRSDSPISQLTNREFEVFRLIGQGRGTREIAGELHLSAKTVEVHRIHIKEKLGLKDATALVHQAIRWFEMENLRGG